MGGVEAVPGQELQMALQPRLLPSVPPEGQEVVVQAVLLPVALYPLIMGGRRVLGAMHAPKATKERAVDNGDRLVLC
jgi:hypothetical protein